MNRSRATTLFLVILGLAMLGLSGERHRPLIEERGTFIHAYAPPEDVPPYVQFVTVAMGGFRGIMADVLWMRLAKLQEEKRYFEIVQLAEWICKLEPKFPEVWEYQAWNETYNISVLFSTPEERWRWVRHGITLLRDEGLRYNPTASKLYWELGWFYQHKLGQDLDQMHFWYKLFWAQEMEALFGGPRPDYARLAGIPKDPEALRMSEGMEAWLKQVEDQPGDPLRKNVPLRQLLAEAARSLPDTVEKALVLDYLRLRLTREEYRLEPSIMMEVDDQFGPFDWRLPQAHSVYWAYRGQPHAKGFYEVHLKRMIFQSMSMAFNDGWLFTDPDGSNLLPRIGANLDLYPKVMKSYAETIEEFPGESTVLTGHRNFMIDAVQKFYLFGKEGEAERVYAALNKRYPGDDTQVTLEEFIGSSILSMSKSELSRGEAAAIVNGAIHQALRWQLLGEGERANRFLSQAAFIRKAYQSHREHSEEYEERTGLPPLSTLLVDARQRLKDELEAEKQRVVSGPGRGEESDTAHEVMLRRLREKIPGEKVIQAEEAARDAGIL